MEIEVSAQKVKILGLLPIYFFKQSHPLNNSIWFLVVIKEMFVQTIRSPCKNVYNWVFIF